MKNFKQKIMKSRKLVIALLVVLAMAASSTTYAYWASSVSSTAATAAAGQTVTIGTGAAVSTTVTFGTITNNSNTSLVPTGRGTPNSITFTFPVTWTDSDTTATGATGTLAVTDVAYSNATALTHANLDAMFSYTVDSGNGAITMDGTNNVVITITFDTDPVDKATYDLIASSTLTTTITFQVTVA
ncbi:MAG: hypothetical protein KAH13_05285, partial [Tenericutes bacterium]|nr:hypothetical protein [Mycoplasmatota bacterium]